MRIVVIGGVAAGMSAASQAKRRAPGADVVAFERSSHVSYGACGIPYNIEDPKRRIEDLVVITPEQFRKERGIDVRVHHQALAVHPDRKIVVVRDLDRCRETEEPYDRLVLATGARPFRPPLAGIDLPGVFVLRELSDGAVLKRHVDETAPRAAVIIGGGYIGLEMADVLRKRGLAVTIVEQAPQLLAGWDPLVGQAAESELRRNDVQIRTDVRVESFEQAAAPGSVVVQTDQGPLAADLVLLAVGIRPNVELAAAAGVKLGGTGAIAVDAHMRTSVPGILAAGDCVEASHRIARRPVWVPLGTTANKQGKVAGANAVDADERFCGILGTAGFRLFDLELARTGLGAAEARSLGLDALASASRHRSRAHAFPGARMVQTILLVERPTGRLLGAQMVGGDAIAKRIDVFAAALQAGMTVADIEDLDLTYAPPFAPVYDPILIAADVARKDLAAKQAQK
jgi:NADPH-dependent 2,4-dienoyl-CoA reductase/sulfur reductase-like enzyme